MSNKTVCIVSLAVGALIGSAAAWIFTKKYYEKISKDEIDSVKKEFSKMRNASSEASDHEEKNNDCFCVVKGYNIIENNELD